ncbi:MAG: hypothetical protein RL497_1312 [Pseudomonadota bacterium]|jgi:23S rRNA pseudouridine2605 synthase
MNDEKLQKVLATAGFGSRREMERVIDAGLVTVNGEVATLGSRVKAGDKLVIDGNRFEVPNRKETQDELRVLLYNKPEGEICSRNDPEGRPTVYDRLPPLNTGRWISVGRLDFNTSGLLLFTNNGELANKLMHPSSGIDREYLVRVQGEVSNDQLQLLRDGVQLEDGLAKFTDITVGGGKGTNTWYYCTLMEGKNREVRRLWEAQGCRVSRLKRVRYGQIIIPSFVRMGQWVELSLAETTLLCEAASLKPPSKKSLTQSEFNQRERREKRLRASPGKPINTSSRAHRSRSEREAFIAKEASNPHAKPGLIRPVSVEIIKPKFRPKPKPEQDAWEQDTHEQPTKTRKPRTQTAPTSAAKPRSSQFEAAAKSRSASSKPEGTSKSRSTTKPARTGKPSGSAKPRTGKPGQAAGSSSSSSKPSHTGRAAKPQTTSPRPKPDRPRK